MTWTIARNAALLFLRLISPGLSAAAFMKSCAQIPAVEDWVGSALRLGSKVRDTVRSTPHRHPSRSMPTLQVNVLCRRRPAQMRNMRFDVGSS